MQPDDPRARDLIREQQDRLTSRDKASTPEFQTLPPSRPKSVVITPLESGDIYTVALQAVQDVMRKHVTVGGVSPQIVGFQIDFPTPPPLSASELFPALNPYTPPPQPQLQAFPQIPAMEPPATASVQQSAPAPMAGQSFFQEPAGFTTQEPDLTESIYPVRNPPSIQQSSVPLVPETNAAPDVMPEAAPIRTEKPVTSPLPTAAPAQSQVPDAAFTPPPALESTPPPPPPQGSTPAPAPAREDPQPAAAAPASPPPQPETRQPDPVMPASPERPVSVEGVIAQTATQEPPRNVEVSQPQTTQPAPQTTTTGTSDQTSSVQEVSSPTTVVPPVSVNQPPPPTEIPFMNAPQTGEKDIVPAPVAPVTSMPGSALESSRTPDTSGAFQGPSSVPVGDLPKPPDSAPQPNDPPQPPNFAPQPTPPESGPRPAEKGENQTRSHEPGEYTSHGQMRGETHHEYRERQKMLRELTSDEATAHAIANGDTSYFNKGFIPVVFTRKDGKRRILVNIDNSTSKVVEGAVSGERQGSLPSEDAYYEAGGGGGSSSILPWTPLITPVTNNSGQVTGYKVKLYPATFAGLMPAGMFAEFQMGLTESKFFVVSANTDGKAVTSCTLDAESGAPVPPTPSLAAAPSTFKTLVAVVASGTGYNLMGKSVSAFPREVLREDKSNPTAFELPYRSYYNWSVQ